MFTIKVCEEIKSPASAVFLFAGDYVNDPTWRHGVSEMKYEGGSSAAAGVRTIETMRSFGSKAVTTAIITDYSEARTAFRSISGPVACEGSREFVAIKDGTRFCYSLTLRPEGFLRLFEPILKMVFMRQVIGDVKRLKGLLEQR